MSRLVARTTPLAVLFCMGWFVATTLPLSERPLRRLVMAQDTGGAIKGAVRADFFWGFGAEAGAQAGRIRQKGEMWVLAQVLAWVQVWEVVQEVVQDSEKGVVL